MEPWCWQTVESLQSTKGKRSEFIKKVFPQFIVNILQHDTYAHVKNFVQVLEGLAELGCPVPLVTSALRCMANRDLTAMTGLEIEQECDLRPMGRSSSAARSIATFRRRGRGPCFERLGWRRTRMNGSSD